MRVSWSAVNVSAGDTRRLVHFFAVVALVLAAVLGTGGTAAAATPHIDNVVPAQGPVGMPVIVNGSNFGVLQSNGRVTFNGVPSTAYGGWTNNNIVCQVPAGASTGPVVVTTAGGFSNSVTFTVTGEPQPAEEPRIESLVPAKGPVGTTVEINGAYFGSTRTAGVVTFNEVPATSFTAWAPTRIVTEVPVGATTGDVVVTTTGGASNGVEFTVTDKPVPGSVWYLAEGCTSQGFETYVLIENTTDGAANVNVTYNTSLGRIPREQVIQVAADSRSTLHVNEDVPGVDVSTEIRSDRTVVCERSMYWNNRVDGHDSIGVTEPAKTWYLAEGCTRGFETWVLIQNPGSLDATVNVTYMTSNGVVQKDPLVVGAGSRQTINVVEDVGECDVSTKVESDREVICERAMYWDSRRGGHDSRGVTSASKAWYLAEGTTSLGFNTWLLLQNPGDPPAAVDVTFMTPAGPRAHPTMILGPRSRTSINVNDQVEDSDTSIEVSSDKEIICERAMYWDNGTGRAGHDTVGVTAPAEITYLAEGSTAWGFETFICIQNPNDEDATVSVTYLTSDGAVEGQTHTVKSGSRLTVFVNQELADKDTSIKVESDLPVMAERPMYWSNRGGGHVSIGWTPEE